jgi:hypothetical protein
MEVIPLTLALSLLLSLTFIALFVREFARPRRAGAEHDSLLPLEDDQPTRVAFHTRHSAEPARGSSAEHADAPPASARDHHHAPGEKCSGGKPGVACCASCQRRKDRASGRNATVAKA